MTSGNQAALLESTSCTRADEAEINRKFQRLQQILRGISPLAVAFSGGIDSALLLKISLDTLGPDRVAAFTAQSEVSPDHEIEDAARLAAAWGARHIILNAHDLDDSEFVSNTERRCYVCKRRRFSLILDHARTLGIHCLAHGENVDDELDFRPGSLAAKELGVHSPLREAGFGKTEIRTLARWLQIDIWGKPSSACLASRIPRGSSITAEKLSQIAQAEYYLRSLGIAHQIRVRHDGPTARIEVEQEAIVGLTQPDIRARLLEKFKQLGFSRFLLDLEGYRTGSLNPSTAKPSDEISAERKREANR
ncbi:MAG: ATP-dependent sacrificial sulfur transferase LarE [Syntrophobacteraceae bacterium]